MKTCNQLDGVFKDNIWLTPSYLPYNSLGLSTDITKLTDFSMNKTIFRHIFHLGMRRSIVVLFMRRNNAVHSYIFVLFNIQQCSSVIIANIVVKRWIYV